MTDLFIDPGIKTGWALFHGGALETYATIREQGVADGAGHAERVNSMTARLRNILAVHRPGRVFIEGVDARGGGRNYAALHGGSLFFLSYMVGAYSAAAAGVEAKVRIVSAQHWKGQLTKEATQAQLRILGYRLDGVVTEHALDAIAMGAFFYTGRWE